MTIDDAGFAIDEGLLRRICGEYLEMPGLRLTRLQAQRLWGLDGQTCANLLEFLVEVEFLRLTGDGRFARTGATISFSKLRMAKAPLDPTAAAPKAVDTSSAA